MKSPEKQSLDSPLAVPRVEKKLTGIEEIARTWGRPEPPRRHPHPFGPKVPIEPADPDEVLRERFGKRREVYLRATDYDAIPRSQIPEDIRRRKGR
jgi:hypothetical protein